MKTCISCKKKKDITEFYVHKKMADGRLNKCKDCCKIQSKQRINSLKKDPKWVESERTRGREKYYRLYKGLKQKNRTKYSARYKNKYPEKYRAKLATSRLKPNTNGNHLHHWSYNKKHFKDVIELKPSLHYKLHRFMEYDQQSCMYLDVNGNLLDTKEKHLDYIEVVKKL